MHMGEGSSLELCISMGPWGGPGGNKWSWMSKGGIKQVVIAHGLGIDSILFKSDDGNGSVEYSVKFGGDGGNRTDKIDIDWPMEYLTGISGKYGCIYPSGPEVINSLCFHTNLTKYGPFGSNTGSTFSLPMEDGTIVGFHGRSGEFLDAIGVHAKPISVSSHDRCFNNQENFESMRLNVPRHPGPWGGVGGKPWDDGVFSAIKKIHVHVGNGSIHALQFQYERSDGNSFWSQKHGGPGGDKINRINLERAYEFLIGITGFYGPLEQHTDLEAIRSISFYTTKGTYGPFGEEIGIYFSSGFGGKILGFHGSSSVYVNAIGVHMEYF